MTRSGCWSALARRAAPHPVITALFCTAAVGQFSMVLQFNSHLWLEIGSSFRGAVEGLLLLAGYSLLFAVVIPFALWLLVCWAFD